MESQRARRQFLRLSVGACAGGILLSGCAGKPEAPASQSPENKGKGGEVTATEDLMREHGVLRRALLVYSAAAVKLRANPSTIAPDALQKTAQLFRSFGEDYHEKKLEEAYIFPAIKGAGGEAAGYADILVAQHTRGREITEYILAVTKGAKLAAGNAESLARSLEALVLMYEHHAALEDTLIFPAWKQTMSDEQLDEMGDKFEEIERQQFGGDGFETALKQISEIEKGLGLSDIAQFTAPPPPKIS